MGNHDRAAFEPIERQVFNPYARSAIEWTSTKLSASNMEYLKSLPMSHSLGGALFIHASPHEPPAWHYVDRPEQFKLAFSGFKEHNLCFIGHTHRPSIVVQDPKGHYYPHSSRSADLIPGFRYLINDGSTGQSRDGLTLASCALYDSEAQTVELLRVPYDVEATRQKIRDAGLPSFLEERLAHGI
jgi:diadenosine tetraphosphatase ApaH/serine/threonine PP2A family protein phosphatase